MASSLHSLTNRFPDHRSLLCPPFGPANKRVLIGSPKFFMTSTFYSNLKMDQNLKKLMGSSRPKETNNFEVSHPIKPEKVEMFKSMEKWAENNILTLLKPVTKSWHPQDLLPDPSSEGFFDQVSELRERTKEIPNDLLVVLIGDMITEEALPTYQSHFSTIDVYGDGGCTSDTPWAIWTRAWSAEENRHGDLLNKYLYLSGRVDMKQVETTIHYLIGSGMDIGSKENPYLLTIYTSFQERATFVSHGNTGKLAMKHGDRKLAQICGTIAADEKRHEQAYTRITKKLFELDPNETVIAFAHMMKKNIIMPAHFMYDGQDDNLFSHFSNVAAKIGVYTIMDYIDILEHLVGVWDVDKLSHGLKGDGREAQNYVCGLAPRLRKMAERAHERTKDVGAMRFSWIYNNEVKV